MVKFKINGMDLTLDGWLQKKLDNVKYLMSKEWDCVFLIDGIEGCLTGNTLIQISRGKLSKRYTLKRLYNHYNNNPDGVIQQNKNFDLTIPTFVRSYNGKDIRLHKIKNITYSGKKQVFLLKLKDGKTITATSNHKFLTRTGWKPLEQLKIKEEIMCDKLHAEKNGRKKIKLYDIQLPVDYHPYASVSKRVEVHRLIYEARMNNLEFTEFLDILLNEPEVAKKLKYIDTKVNCIHHKDGCHYNNSIDNLELIKLEDHLKCHSNNMYSNFSQGSPVFSEINLIKRKGVEDTYDIECEEPYHNFVANGIVVHNSGKSTLGFACAWYISDGKITMTNICEGTEDASNKLESLPDKSVLIIDEGSLSFGSKDVMRKEQRRLIKILNVIRQKRMCLIIISPSFFDLNKYISADRSRFLLHTYTNKKLERGRFTFFGEKKKKILYQLGKKNFNSYAKPKADFCGRFFKFDPFGEEYLKLKKKSLMEAFHEKEDYNKYRVQRDGAIREWRKEGVTLINMSKRTESWDESLSKTQIGRICQQITPPSLK